MSTFGEKPFVVPGVGSYAIKEPKSHQTVSFHSRVADLSDKWIREVPGPGTYQTLELIDKNLKSSISKFGNARSQKFSKEECRGDFERKIIKQNIPGPGHCIFPPIKMDLTSITILLTGSNRTKEPLSVGCPGRTWPTNLEYQDQALIATPLSLFIDPLIIYIQCSKIHQERLSSSSRSWPKIATPRAASRSWGKSPRLSSSGHFGTSPLTRLASLTKSMIRNSTDKS